MTAPAGGGRVRVVVVGSELPGRRCVGRVDVHVGQCVRRDAPGSVPLADKPYRAIGLVPADVPSARWRCEVALRPTDERGHDFGGPFVLGARGDRHLGLAWTEPAPDGTLHLFRGTKLRLDDVEPALATAADQPGHHLVVRVALTGRDGGPRTGTVRPPHVEWSVEADDA